MKKLIAIILLLPVMAFAYTPQGYVNDFAGVLTLEQKNILERRLDSFEKSTSNEFSVVIVPSLEGDYIEHYAAKLFEEWGIGKADTDNGVLLLVAIEERELRVEVGYGLEPYISDSEADSVIRNVITPEFKRGDYYTGITKGVDALIGLTNGSYVVEEKSRLNIDPEFFIFGFIFLLSILGSTKSWWLGGVIGAGAGVIASFFVGSILLGIGITIGLTLLGLLIDFIVSKHGGKGGGMFWGGGSHGGGGFGGFGGGMSGGGGASGRW